MSFFYFPKDKEIVKSLLESSSQNNKLMIPVKSSKDSHLVAINTHLFNISLKATIEQILVSILVPSASIGILAINSSLLLSQYDSIDFVKLNKNFDDKKQIFGDNVYACLNGVVSHVSNTTFGAACGKCVILKHDGYFSIYAHLNTVNVKDGDVVDKGDILGTVGNTGNSSSPHLHFGLAYTNPKITAYIGIGSISKKLNNVEDHYYVPLSDANDTIGVTKDMYVNFFKLKQKLKETPIKYIKNTSGTIHPMCLIKNV